MEISIGGNSRGLYRDALALNRRYHVELSLTFFSFYSTTYGGTMRPRLFSLLRLFFPPSTSSGLTFRRFALSSVTFIVYGVDDEVADDEVYSDAPRSSGPAGRPSQSECLISYFWFSYFVAALFLLLLFLIFCPNLLSLPSRRSPTRSVSRSHVLNHRTRSASRHHPCKLESSRILSAQCSRRIPSVFSAR